MRRGFALSFLVVLLFAGGYFYYIAEALCPAPLAYSIGEIDDSFHISFDEVRLVLADAEGVWEEATGQNLFNYDPDAEFSVNLIYDDRQAYIDAENKFKQKLETVQDVNEELNFAYTKLISKYNQLQVSYSTKAKKYEEELQLYNEKVSELNEGGGATKEEFELLQKQKEALEVKRKALEELTRELNKLVEEINNIGDRGNKLVETYNNEVRQYNNTFGESKEFTQGTYSTDKKINVYSFEDSDELRLVFAHEFGHALSLDHVSNEQSVMYFLIGKQPKDFNLTNEDIDEFARVCGKKSFWGTIKTILFNH